MNCPPRIALGTVQANASLAPLSWALLDVLNRRGLNIQCFQSRACFTPLDGAAAVTGLKARHLDTWLMSREFCREIFFRPARADFALVEGQFAIVPPLAPAETGAAPLGGDLQTLCDWLDLPRLAVIDAALLESDGSGLLPPDRLDGVLFDRVRDRGQAEVLRAHFESLWGVPVLGWLEELPVLREMLRSLRTGSAPPRDLCAAFGQNLADSLQREKLLQLAQSRPAPALASAQAPFRAARRAPVHVSVAFDAAFHCYFPDTLDMLELQGALVRDFSPLRDEELPEETDIVYIGCGQPQHFARELAENLCLLAALRSHVCAGKRIYCEGGGLAYLSRELHLPCGDAFPMVGAIPAIARLNLRPAPPQPVELTLNQSNWLGSAGEPVRGYLNSTWELEPAGTLVDYAQEPEQARRLVGRRNALASRLHLHFAARPAQVERFIAPLAIPS
jgi:cobyrinic acid a,c-diamide synthase